MRKVAVHRVFLAPFNKWLSMQVVELDLSGKVAGLMSLCEEQRATEWLGGVIVIASKSPERMEGESFSDFCNRLCSEEDAVSLADCQAYHIIQFDVAGMNFTPASRLICL